jgi:hypothetical protein
VRSGQAPYHGKSSHPERQEFNLPGVERSGFPLVLQMEAMQRLKARGVVMAAKKKSARKKKSAGKKKTTRRKWSAAVTKHSDALDLKDKVFKGTPTQIAASLKRSAEHSHRRKSSPFRSAMSMLTFYTNRAGKNLSASRRKKLDAAKEKLREAFDRA